MAKQDAKNLRMCKRLWGTPPYNRDAYQGNDFAGVVNGLAWTP